MTCMLFSLNVKSYKMQSKQNSLRYKFSWKTPSGNRNEWQNVSLTHSRGSIARN